MSDDESPALVAVRLDDLRQVLAAANSNPYLGDVPGSMDYLDRLEAIAESADLKGDAAQETTHWL